MKRTRRGVAVALASALVVLLLVMGVFSVASLSRTVAQGSSRVHAWDEVLKSVTVIRAQLGFGIVLSDLNETTVVEASSAIEVSTRDVASSIDDLERSIAFIADDLGGLDSTTELALDRFSDKVDQLRLDRSDPSQRTDELIGSFDRQYDQTSLLVAAERDRALDEVTGADADLSRIGTLVNFLVAFVVPTAAFGIYRALTRPETELLVADAQITKDTVLRVLRRNLLLRAIDEITSDLADSAVYGQMGPELKERLDALRLTAVSLDRAHETSFSNVELAVVLSRTTDRIGDRKGSSVACTVSCNEALEVWSDPGVLDVVLASLMADCLGSGSDRIAISATLDGDFVEIRIAKNGARRSPAELRLLSKQGTVADRLALLGGSDNAIVAALYLTEDVGGSLDLVEVGEQQSFVLNLPVPTRSISRPNTLLLGRT